MDSGLQFKTACEAGDVPEFKRLLGELLHAIGNQGLSSASTASGPPLSPSTADVDAPAPAVVSPTRGPRSPLGSMMGSPTRQQLRDKEKLLAMKRAKLKTFIVCLLSESPEAPPWSSTLAAWGQVVQF